MVAAEGRAVISVPSVAKNIYSLAEFGGAADTEPNVRSETIYDDNGKLSAQIVYDANGNMTLFAMYPDSGGKVVVTSAYDSSGNQTSNICTTYDANGNILSREDMPVVTENIPVTETTEAIESVIPAQPAPLVVGAGIQSFASDVSASSQADLWLLEAELLYDDGGMMLMSAPSGPSAASEVFTYDHLGNLYQYTDKDGYVTTYTNNPVNQYGLISKDLNFFGFKDERYPLHDDNGNMTEDGQGYIYTYDYRNRLVSISDGVTTIAQYTYDALGRRIAKTVGDTTTLFYYNPNHQVIAEYEGTTPQLTREYVYGNSINEILCMFSPQDDIGEEDFLQFLAFCVAWLSETGDGNYDDTLDVVNDNKIDFKDFAVFAAQWGPFPSNAESHFYYLTDALGSVRGLIGGKFNREEDREFYNYDVYGATIDSSVSVNPLRFAGYCYDSESLLYYMYFRTYDPFTGRMLQLDPWGYIDSMNLYEYVVSNPVNFIDPYGSASQPVIPVPNPPNYPQPYPGSGGSKVFVESSHNPPSSFKTDKAYAKDRGMDFHKIGTKRDKNDNIVSSPEDQLAKIAGKYKKGCISELTLSGHGKQAGISTELGWRSGINGDIDPYTASQIATKLCPDAVVNICSCHPADYQQNHQMLADKLQAKVCACDGPLYAPCNCAGSWKCKTPKAVNPGIASGRLAQKEGVQGITGTF